MVPTMRIHTGVSLRGELLRLGRSLGIAPYRPHHVPSADQWESQYTAGGWDYLGSISEAARFGVLASYVRAQSDGVVVDMGCGAGLLRGHLEGIPFRSYLGVDPTAAAIRHAAERWSEDERTSFLVADPLLAELPPADIVILSEVLYMVPDPEALMDRAWEVLRPRGNALISIWHHPGDRALWRMLRRRFRPQDEVVLRAAGSRGGGCTWRIGCYGKRTRPR